MPKVTFIVVVFLPIAMCQADIVFWLGDLNYRIDEKVSDAEVFEMLRKDDLETLRYDDLESPRELTLHVALCPARL